MEPYSVRNLNPSNIGVYTYDVIPIKLKNQIQFIIEHTFGFDRFIHSDDVESFYKLILERLEEIHGNRSIGGSGKYQYDVLQYLVTVKDTDMFLDIVELCFRFIVKYIREKPNYKSTYNASIEAEDAVIKLNRYFRLSSVGYQFMDDVIIKISNDHLHNEIVVPTVKLINNPLFANANSEYVKAHQHYKSGLNKECLNECLKAYESTLKIIFTEKGWTYDPYGSLNDLVSIAYSNQLIPEYLKTYLGSLRTILTNGVNTIRNRVGGHGQGPTVNTADDETTRFTLNLTGSNIIYLIEMSNVSR